MKTLTVDYRAKLAILAEAARLLQERHNALAEMVLVGVGAKDAPKLKRARARLDEAYADFNDAVGELGSIITGAGAFESPAVMSA